MAFGVGDSLSVVIDAQTQRAEGKIESFGRSLTGLVDNSVVASAALHGLAGRADETGDEMSSLSRAVLQASSSLNIFSSSALSARTAIGGLRVATLLSLVPALVTLSTTLAPIIASLGGFVAVLGSIGGIGIIGALAAITANTEELKQQFNEVLGVLQDEFSYAILLATEVLDSLMESFIDIIPELVPAQDTIEQLAGKFLLLGETLIDALPAFVSLATTLAQEFLNPFSRLLQDILPQIPGMVMSMVQAFKRMIPFVMRAGRALGEMWPELQEFGFVALGVVSNTLGMLASGFNRVLEAVTAMDVGTQKLIAQITLALPLLSALSGLVGGLSLPLLAVAAAVGVFALAWQQDLGRVREITSNLMSELNRVLGDRIPALLDASRQFWNQWGDEITLVIEGLLDILGTALISTIDLGISALTALLQFLSGDFAGAFETMEGVLIRFRNNIATLFNRLTGGIFESFVNGVINAVNTLGNALEEFANFVGQGDKFNFEEFKSFEQQVSIPGTGPEGRVGDTSQGRVARSPTEVMVEITGDTDVIRDVSTEVVEDRERRTNRNTGSF